MALRLSHLAADERTVPLRLGDETLAITYRPSGYTPEVEERVADARDDEKRQMRPVVELLSGLLVKWDLIDEKGKMIPTDQAQLRRLPYRFLAQVLNAVVEDMKPGEADATSDAT